MTAFVLALDAEWGFEQEHGPVLGALTSACVLRARPRVSQARETVTVASRSVANATTVSQPSSLKWVSIASRSAIVAKRALELLDPAAERLKLPLQVGDAEILPSGEMVPYTGG